jgi:Phasin protein
MTYFPEQLSAAGTRQVDAQLEFMHAFTAQAVASAGQVLVLNISTSRATAERAADTFRQLFSITDPRDLFALGSQTQAQLSAMYAYGRELLNIATDARLNLARRNAGLPTPAPQPQAASVPAAAGAGERASEPLARRAKPAGKLMAVPDAQSSPAPRAKTKPVAKAVGEATGKRAGAPHPAASPLATGQAGDVPLPRLAPSDVAPVPELRPPKSRRKK